jgi:hypothetical protein
MIRKFIDHHLSPALYVAAILSLALALAEAAIQIAGYSLLNRLYSPGRMMELAATLLLFAILPVLWQIRDELRRR